MSEYPSEEEIGHLGLFNGPLAKWFEYIKSIWWNADWGVEEYTERRPGLDPIFVVELHTGGWSGNEEIIRTMMDHVYWMFSWQATRRGGHFLFHVRDLKDKEPKA